ncbi:MAG: hypothetical protein JNM56_00585 [Planctomycetia bacterium]|nr:hypothetical protein [Planctomycetia bacterium]
MNHISLDSQEEAVKRSVLSLPADPQGSMLELSGQAVVCVLPASAVGEADDASPWTEAKNSRRCDLIDRKFAGGITPAEALELARLQEQLIRYRQQVAPLPLEEVRKLHQELLAKAAASGS